ncbi:MAG: hypothetical protein DRJ52_00220 [Thermoprotei archaeon]|nr:MAG: hypothetical protein DRJ52_00220 [Thermoprotei archaeon]RLF00964.1 MAG: hypothetical protein DRJ63_00970 [Thermoprotei archaeon]
MIDISIAADVKRDYEGIALGIGIVSGVTVRKSGDKERRLLENITSIIRSRYSLEILKIDPVVRAYRDFYWRLGIDPTKTRPASEALVRRALRGKIPLINNVVDAGNAASMETLVPIGLYDVDRIKGNVLLRYAKEGEFFLPIGGKPEKLTRKSIVLADEEKVLHVFPHRDSQFTMIRASTKTVLIISCGVPGVPLDLVQSALKKTIRYILLLAGGKVSFETIRQ